MSNSTDVISYRKRIKSALVDAFGNKCFCCGKTYPQYMYDFHHLNPSEKSFNLSGNGITRAKDVYAVEAKKCIMVCSNCHRMIEYGDINMTGVKSNFDVDVYYQSIQQSIDEQKKILQSLRQQQQDDNIRKKKKGVIKRNIVYPTREQLKELIRTTSFIKIGQMYGFSDNAVRKWCDKMNLPRTKEDINAYSDEEWALI